MTTKTLGATRVNTDLLATVFTIALGVGLIFVAGFSNAAMMHDVGHDQRHAVAFPCH